MKVFYSLVVSIALCLSGCSNKSTNKHIAVQDDVVVPLFKTDSALTMDYVQALNIGYGANNPMVIDSLIERWSTLTARENDSIGSLSVQNLAHITGLLESFIKICYGSDTLMMDDSTRTLLSLSSRDKERVLWLPASIYFSVYDSLTSVLNVKNGYGYVAFPKQDGFRVPVVYGYPTILVALEKFLPPVCPCYLDPYGITCRQNAAPKINYVGERLPMFSGDACGYGQVSSIGSSPKPLRGCIDNQGLSAQIEVMVQGYISVRLFMSRHDAIWHIDSSTITGAI